MIAPGRNSAVLADLERRFGPRVRTVRLTGEADADRERMRRAAPGPVDCVLDLLPPTAPATAVRAAALTVREGGRVVLMGGVGMLGGEPLSLPYPWIMRNNIHVIGSWIDPRTAGAQLAALVHAGLLRLEEFEVTPFALDAANEAVRHAAWHGGPFRMTVLEP